MSARSEQADADMRLLTGLGLRLFPVSDKRPTWPGWQTHATNDPDRLYSMVADAQDERRYGGLGAVTGESHAVLDIDHAEGLAAFEALAHENGELLIVEGHLIGRTPRGGWHLWFSLPSGVKPPGNRTHLLDLPVDFRGRGGLAVVLGPGRSLHGHHTPLLPAWLGRVLGTGRAGAVATRPHAPDRLTNSRLLALLRTIETAAEGGRNATLFWASCRAWDGWLRLARERRPPAHRMGARLALAGTRAGLRDAEAEATVRSAFTTVLADTGAVRGQ